MPYFTSMPVMDGSRAPNITDIIMNVTGGRIGGMAFMLFSDRLRNVIFCILGGVKMKKKTERILLEQKRLGYAQVAGLPPVYGLYGSVFPILIYALFTSSPQFVFGVDATPAALVGGTLASLGITGGSPEAMALVPVITLLTACWLFLFYFIKAGKLVNYISKPVMGGFISGIGCTIILMQIPKLFGGNAGTGELFVLLYHIWQELPSFHPLSAVLGAGCVVILQISRKKAPKVPMSVLLMAVGAGRTACSVGDAKACLAGFKAVFPQCG